MLIAYLDEFGHQGPFIDHSHRKFNTHPMFGYGGYILPADNVRIFGGFFEKVKEHLLSWEIKNSGQHPRRWEKKGSALLTTKNFQSYGDEIQPALRRLYRHLNQLDGRIFFYGQEKPLGPVSQTGETSQARESHCLIQAMRRLGTYAAKKSEKLLVIMDATDTDNRERAVSTLGKTIYGRSDHDTNSIIEVPIQADSHLYGTVQFADWTCALLGRLSDYHFADASEFGWAVDLGRHLWNANNFTTNSVIWGRTDDRSRCFPKMLLNTTTFREKEAQKAKKEAARTARNQSMQQRLIDAASPEFQQKLNEIRFS